MLLILGLRKMRGKNKPEKKGSVSSCNGTVFPGTGKNCFLIAHWGKSGDKITPEKNKNVKKKKKKVSERQKKASRAQFSYYAYKNDHFFELHN
jgi:hypothetical protein